MSFNKGGCRLVTEFRVEVTLHLNLVFLKAKKSVSCFCQKAINDLSFSHPTPIQASTVPVALMGKDICACAATGTG